jgi:phosphoribosylanthranilate isomerase
MNTPSLNQPGMVQVAGVIDQAEADMLVSCGVRWLGFPLRLPVNEVDLSEEAAARIIRALPAHCHGVVISYSGDAREVLELCRSLGARVVQLHGDITAEALRAIRRADPGLGIIKSLVVGEHGPARLRDMVASLSAQVDAFITDTFDPVTGASGATGRTHDWGVSRDLVTLSPRPVILAGGLKPDNVREAVLRVRPAGVDAHTGLEGPDGRKDRGLVERFLAEARAGFAGARSPRP